MRGRALTIYSLGAVRGPGSRRSARRRARRAARARAGRRPRRPLSRAARLARRGDAEGRPLGSEPDLAERAPCRAGPRRRSPTSASSTSAPRRSRSRCSTRTGCCRSARSTRRWRYTVRSARGRRLAGALLPEAAEGVGRTFARLVPSDRVQAAALVRLTCVQQGVQRLALLTTRTRRSSRCSTQFARTRARRGSPSSRARSSTRTVKDYRDLIASVLAAAPRCRPLRGRLAGRQRGAAVASSSRLRTQA